MPISRTRRRVLRHMGAAACAAMTPSASARGLIHRRLPRSQIAWPVVGIGTYDTFNVGPRAPERTELAQVLREFVALGGTVVDSSPMYGEAERVVGDLSAELGNRDKLYLATKVWTSGERAGMRQMEESFSLMRAGKQMDLMQIHNLLDLSVHTRTLREWKAAGRIRHMGITHYHAGAHAELEKLAKTTTYDSVQVNYSMAERDAEAHLLPACADAGVAVIVNRPFAQASLFSRVKGRALPPWCADFDCTSWAQFFLKFVLGHPAVTCVIPGTRRVAHLRDNMAAGMGRLPDGAQRKRMADHLASL
jgi:aryl-alcohol dehydrogenase-like predicted oxidoreductase